MKKIRTNLKLKRKLLAPFESQEFLDQFVFPWDKGADFCGAH